MKKPEVQVPPRSPHDLFPPGSGCLAPLGWFCYQHCGWRRNRIAFLRWEPPVRWSNKCPGPPREKKSGLATSPRTLAASVCLCVPSKSEPTSAAGRLMNTNDCPVPCRGVFNTSHVSATLSNHLPKSARAAPPSHGKRHGDE